MSKEANKTQRALSLALKALNNTYALRDDVIEAKKALEEALVADLSAPKQEQGEPVAWWIPKAEQFCLQSPSGKRPFAKAWEPLYTTPQQRKPLTDEQIESIADEYLVDYRIPAGCAWNFARDIEAAHGIKE